jgi:hypothetical protein
MVITEKRFYHNVMVITKNAFRRFPKPAPSPRFEWQDPAGISPALDKAAFCKQDKD